METWTNKHTKPTKTVRLLMNKEVLLRKSTPITAVEKVTIHCIWLCFTAEVSEKQHRSNTWFLGADLWNMLSIKIHAQKQSPWNKKKSWGINLIKKSLMYIFWAVTQGPKDHTFRLTIQIHAYYTFCTSLTDSIHHVFPTKRKPNVSHFGHLLLPSGELLSLHLKKCIENFFCIWEIIDHSDLPKH